jgi:hypothetical protein
LKFHCSFGKIFSLLLLLLLFFFFSDMLSTLTNHVESMLTMKDQVASIQQDLLRLRVAVMPDLPPEEAQSIYHPTQFDDLIDFRAFCSKLAADPEFRLLVVSNSLVRFCALVQLHIRFSEKIPCSAHGNVRHLQHCAQHRQMPPE